MDTLGYKHIKIDRVCREDDCAEHVGLPGCESWQRYRTNTQQRSRSKSRGRRQGNRRMQRFEARRFSKGLKWLIDWTDGWIDEGMIERKNGRTLQRDFNCY